MSVSTISIIASAFVGVLLLFFMIKGWRRGFLRILFSTFSIIITIVVSSLLTGPAAAWLKESTFVGPYVLERVSDYVSEKTADIVPEAVAPGAGDTAADTKITGVAAASGNSIDAAQSETPQSTDKQDISSGEDGFIDSLLLPEFVKVMLKGQNTAADYARMQVAGFQEYISVQISGIIVKIIAFLLLMIVVYILLRIILRLLRFIDRLPGIRGINRLLGAILGLAEAMLIIWIICLLLSLFASSQFGCEVLSIIRASRFLSFIYENNLISMAAKAIFNL